MKDTARRSVQAGENQAPAPQERLLTIGQVVTLLQADFRDLSITKLRYLEDRGLLAPSRTKGRYRKYSAADLHRLRTILTLQRDEYLPLEVIRQRVDRSVAPGTGQPVASAVVPGRTSPLIRPEEPAYSLDEVCKTVGVNAQFVQTLLEYRLIDMAARTGPAFTDGDLEIVRICHLLTRFGVEPRNLRLVASSAEREATVIEQIVTPALKSTHTDKREYGEGLLSDLGALFSQLRHLLLYKELRRFL